ncbi:MAG TPA: hypothetical protein PK200_06235, partial [Spirochaetota bacterium]|nr:hypothetical protein [Spirochaetota bacterium]
KSNYYFYEKELRRWQRSRDTLDALVEEAEDYAHNRNMEGVNGPGFLRNIYSLYGLNPEGENDPYLMTEAERNYELARREKEYWEGRLKIAEDVMKYAFPGEYTGDNEYTANGIRESAEVTVTRKENTEKAMNEAKTAYEAELRGVQSIVTEMQAIQGTRPPEGTAEDSPEWQAYSQSIGYLSEELNEKKRLLDEAGEKYAQFRQAMILLENGEGAEFMLRELEELQGAMASSEKNLRERREEYFSRMWEAERIDRLGAYGELCDEVIHSRERAKRSWNGLKSIVAGEETDAHLSLWMNALKNDAVKREIWGESTAEISALTSLYDRWQNASGEERGAARDSFTKALRDEYRRIESAWNTADEQYRLLTDKTFDPGSYTGESETRKEEIVVVEYGRYAALSEDAFERILGSMNTLKGDDRSGEKLLETLKEGMGTFRYGEDNSVFLARNAAYRWAADMLDGITGDNWNEYRAVVEEKLSLTRDMKELYNDREDFREDIALYREAAAGGDETARKLLQEYYAPGRSLELLGYITEYDTGAQAALEKFSSTLGFVYEHEGIFYRSEAEVTETDYTGDLFAYINGHSTSGITFSEETLSSLTSEELREMSALAVGYLASLRENGKEVPGSLYRIISELESSNTELDELLFVREHAGDMSYTELLEQAARDRDTAAKASEFADRVLGMFDGEEVTDLVFAFDDVRYRSLSAVLELFDGLDDAVKTVLADTYTAGPVRDFLNELPELRETQYAFEKAALTNEYTASGGGLSPVEFVNARCPGWSDARKQELTAYLTSIREKILYRTAYPGGSIAAYLDQRRTEAGYSDETYREMTEYALVDYYMGMEEYGIPSWGAAADEFAEFSLLYYCEDYLMGRQEEYEGAADKSAFLDEAIGDYVAAGGDTVDPAKGGLYREFAEGFFNGDRSSMDYLPEDVKIYLYRRDYYETMFSRSMTLYGEEALEEYLISMYGEGVVEDSAREALASYINELNVIDRYYGDDVEAYIATLGPFERTVLNRYRHVVSAGEGEESIMPGFDCGIYGLGGQQALGEELWGRIISEKTTALGEQFAAMQESLHGTLRERAIALSQAERLAEFNEHPERFTSYRNCILPLTEVPGEGEAMPLHGTAVMDAGAVIDGRDESGVINSVMYAGADDQGRMLGSMIIEATNGVYQLLRELVTASKGETAEAMASGNISGFIDDLNSVYNPDTTYGYDEAAGYGFDGALENLMADIRTRQADRGGSSLE